MTGLLKGAMTPLTKGERRCRACDARLPKLTAELAIVYGYSLICQPCLAAAAKLAGEEDSLATFRL